MRAVWAGFTAVGAVALAAPVAVGLARGDLCGSEWTLFGFGPFWAAGVIGGWRQPGCRAWLWLLASGALAMADSGLGDIVVPSVVGWSAAWLMWLVHNWLS